jgi:hypothetical protein
VERYIKHLYRNLEKEMIFEEVQKIVDKLETIEEDDKDTIIYITNAIDERITKLMLNAEENTVCIKDMALWSPILAQSNLIIQYWNITIKGARQHTNVRKRLRSILEKMTQETKSTIQKTSGSATRAMRKAIKVHNQLVKEHKQHREDHLLQKVNDLNERGDGNGKMQVED